MAEARQGKARLARLIGGLGVVVLGVAGCVSMPDGGPPNQYSVDQNDTGQGQDVVGPIPASPMPNASPAQIVQGFLFASASYYTVGSVAREFLTPAAQNAWKPDSVTVFHTWNANDPLVLPAGHNKAQNTVQIYGQVQARLNGAGQLYVAAGPGNGLDAQPSQAAGACSANGPGSDACYSFTLVKSDGQWRIQWAPPNLLVEENDFQRGWATQDLYFFDANRHVLVPDSVFVPIGTSESDVLNKLAQALLKGPAQASWLSGATGGNVFPANVSVTVQSNTPAALVYLRGTLTSAEQKALPLMAAELVWTLTAPSSVSQSQIQSVTLFVNGTQWNPNPNQQLERSTYEKYNPYPAMAAAFTYIDQHGVPQSRCGSTENATAGQATPVFGQAGAVTLAQCTASSPGAAASSSPAATQSATSGKQGADTHREESKPATYSRVAVSPDGGYVAVVSAKGGMLSIGAVGGHSSLKQVAGPLQDITSISWDRRDDLWLTENGNVMMVPATSGKAYQITGLSGVSALSVAPDGVRVALLLEQNVSGSNLELAAINPSGNESQQQVPGEHASGPTVGTPVPLGPGITGSALAWYDANDLIVLAPPSVANPTGELDEVPVDGRAGSSLPLPPTSPGQTVQSIAAGNSANMLVAGLSGDQLAVSVSSEGPWQTLTSGGSQPSYWIQLAS
jgi:Lipoprotein LpqB beta-propeller domain/Sporulation and spore germination